MANTFLHAKRWAVLLLVGSVSAHATIYCASNADELTNALTSAENDKASSYEIRLSAGQYLAPPGGWHVAIQASRGITISGGFSGQNCENQTANASLTVLDGHNAERPLTIDAPWDYPSPPSPIIVRNITFKNGLGDRVGGLKISDAGPITASSILIERNIFLENVATTYEQDNSAGGLLAATDGPDASGNVFLVVRGNLFAGNRAPDGAAAMLFSNNAIDVSNNTVYGNQSLDSALQMRSAFTTFTFFSVNYSNNVFWGNNPDGLPETYDFRADNVFGSNIAANLFNNDFQVVHGTPNTSQNNLSVDPKFVAPATDDFHLAADSTLIDAGDDIPNGGASNVDLDDIVRPQGPHVDIGAYEWHDLPADTYSVTPSVVGNGTITPSVPQMVNDGSAITFTLAPAADYHVVSVTGTCGGNLVGNTYTTDAVIADCTVVASFDDHIFLDDFE